MGLGWESSGVFHAKGWGSKSLFPASKVRSLALHPRGNKCPENLAGMSRTPRGVQKSLCSFAVPKHDQGRDPASCCSVVCKRWRRHSLASLCMLMWAAQRLEALGAHADTLWVMFTIILYLTVRQSTAASPHPSRWPTRSSPLPQFRQNQPMGQESHILRWYTTHIQHSQLTL